MASKNFIEILSKYSSYDYNNGTDKNTTHSYGGLYSVVFSLLKNRTNLTILEIGIQAGYFLKCMYEYLPDADINGIDVNFDILLKDLNPNINTYLLNGCDSETPKKINKTYDIIIEDASHIKEEQLLTFEIFLPYMKDNSIYILEDVADFNFTYLEKGFNEICKKHNIEKTVMDFRHIKKRLDDIVFVFTKN